MNQCKNKRAIIIGATSGIGYETARLLLEDGWTIGIAGRREEVLKRFQSENPHRIRYRAIDIREEHAAEELRLLIDELGGMDLFLHSSGIGKQNFTLEPAVELDTAKTNVEGFMRMLHVAFHYFASQGKGHIAVISSIAGTKGLGIAPAYSATKRFQNTYMDALEQLAYMHGWRELFFTDIRPGFVATPLLNDGKNYPFLMSPQKVARRIVRAIYRRERVVVIDWKYRFLVACWKLIPACLWRRLPIRNG